MSKSDEKTCSNCIYRSNSSVLYYCSLKEKYTDANYVCRDHEEESA